MPLTSVKCVSMYIAVIVLGGEGGAPLLHPQVGEISFRGEEEIQGGGRGKAERKVGREVASSGKVQQIPPTPAPCLSWARL